MSGGGSRERAERIDDRRRPPPLSIVAIKRDALFRLGEEPVHLRTA